VLVWTDAENLVPTGIRSSDPRVCSKSLYLLPHTDSYFYLGTLANVSSGRRDYFPKTRVLDLSTFRMMLFAHPQVNLSACQVFMSRWNATNLDSMSKNCRCVVSRDGLYSFEIGLNVLGK
jgi:hypothetical protein